MHGPHPRRRRQTALAVAALVALALPASSRAAAPTTITRGSLGIWEISNFDNSTQTASAAPTASGTQASFSYGPATPPLGSGSLRQRVGSDGDDAQRLRTGSFNGASLASLELSYSTFVENNNGGQATYAQLFVDTTGDGAFDDILFFEPVYQSGTYGGDAVPNQCPAVPACVTLGGWQTWNATAGGWWSLNAGTFGPPLVTLATYTAANPGAALAKDVPALRLTAGFGAGAWNGYDGYVDAVTVKGTTYDLDVAKVVVTNQAMGVWQSMNFDSAHGRQVAYATASGTRGTFVNGPAPAPLGGGSFRQIVGSNGDDAQRLRTDAYNGTALGSLELRYSTFVAANQGGQAPYVQLFVDSSGDGTSDDILFFEPVYQSGTYGGDAVPNQCPGVPSCVAVGAWQSWNATEGGWWSLNAGTFGPPLTTLAGYLAAHPGAKLATNTPALRLTAGFGAGAWNGFDGNVDAVVVNDTVYDFERVGAAAHHPFGKLQKPTSFQILTGSSNLVAQWQDVSAEESVLGYIVLVGRPGDFANAKARRVLKGDPGYPCAGGVCTLTIGFPFQGLPVNGKYAIAVVTIFSDGHRSDGRCDDGSPFGTAVACDAVVTHAPGYDRPTGTVAGTTAPLAAYEFLMRQRAWPRAYQDGTFRNTLLVDPANSEFEFVAWRPAQIEELFAGRATFVEAGPQTLMNGSAGPATVEAAFSDSEASGAVARMALPPAHVIVRGARQ